jgi:hypothetical protein
VAAREGRPADILTLQRALGWGAHEEIIGGIADDRETVVPFAACRSAAAVSCRASSSGKPDFAN